ncbi:Grainyhead-like protein 2 [Homalodisca vitripennis]|nr:Grainyhead-like protein 2 [Homalodisca vitripennis]
MFGSVYTRRWRCTDDHSKARGSSSRSRISHVCQQWSLGHEDKPVVVVTGSRQSLLATSIKSIVMLMFREEKSPEDEIKAWQFWHGRQHSVKQRILDAGSIEFCGILSKTSSEILDFDAEREQTVILYYDVKDFPTSRAVGGKDDT